jgi:hypothetical protein
MADVAAAGIFIFIPFTLFALAFLRQQLHARATVKKM